MTGEINYRYTFLPSSMFNTSCVIASLTLATCDRLLLSAKKFFNCSRAYKLIVKTLLHKNFEYCLQYIKIKIIFSIII